MLNKNFLAVFIQWDYSELTNEDLSPGARLVRDPVVTLLPVDQPETDMYCLTP